MTPRPSRVIAIARRDLKMELKGRRGLGLPLVIAGLLLPVSGAPRQGGNAILPVDTVATVTVSGDVPRGIVDLENVSRVDDDGMVRFTRRSDSLEVAGAVISPEMRQVLDTDGPSVSLARTSRPIPVPSRSLLFALISASTLTGAVSSSVGGERSARTLVALLAAAVTRSEVVLGKWLGWGGLGVSTAVGAALVAILLGRLEAGWWLLPMITVPLCAVALSLWLVRRASDVIGGTTVTLRVVPALVGGAGLLSWFVGLDAPVAGAAIPLGGALIAAGSTWGPGPLPALVAASSTILTTALFLRATWRDLEETIGPPAPPSRKGLAVRTSILAALVWWPPLLGPMLWAPAGNPGLTQSLPRGPGVLAAAMGLLLLTWVHTNRGSLPTDRDWARRAPPWKWGAAVAVGAALAMLLGHPLTPLPEHLADAQTRLHDAVVPGWAGPVAWIGSAVALELVFRGWLPHRVGWRWATAAWIVTIAPLDPIGGLAAALSLGWLARDGHLGPAILAHLIWAGVTLW